MSTQQDRVIRAITDDNTFRVIVASTTDTIRQAVAAQAPPQAAAAPYAELLTGTVLVRETMSPHHRVQGILAGAGGQGRLIADAHPDGSTRGLVQLPAGWEAFRFGRGSVLQVMRTMANGSVYRGLVDAAHCADVQSALMAYMQDSEQIVSVIATAIAGTDETIALAGGYVVQLLPEGQRSALRAMTERLESLPALDQLLHQTQGAPHQLLDALVGNTAYAQLDDRPVRFRCWCTAEAVVAALATLGRDELAELVHDQEVIELSCDYCHRRYRVGRAQVQGLLETS